MGDTRREQLAALPFAEKLRILDKLRARSLAIAAAGLRGSESKIEDETSGSQDDKADESK
jgi:hypothetical protein